MTTDSTEGFALGSYLAVMARWKWLIAAVTILIGLAGAAYAWTRTPMYSATTQMLYVQQVFTNNPLGPTSVDQTLQQADIGSVPAVIASSQVSNAAAKLLSSRDNSAGYLVSVALQNNADNSGYASVVGVNGVSSRSATAAAAANAYAQAFIGWRRDSALAQVNQAILAVQGALQSYTTPSSRTTPDYLTLTQRLLDLQLLQKTVTGGFSVITPASAPSAPFSPHKTRTLAVAIIAGLVAGIGLAFVLEQLDTRVRSYREVGEILGVPILARLPRIPRHTLHTSELVALTDPEGSASEALRILRSNLEWTSVDEPLRSVVVTSCLKGEGKTVTLCNLAVAFARAGNRVVIVDADLRDPQVHRIFNVPNAVGLTSVVLGRTKINDAMQVLPPPMLHRSTVGDGPSMPKPSVSWDAAQWEDELDDALRELEVTGAQARVVAKERTPKRAELKSSGSGQGLGALIVLPSGPLPPDPGELVSSRRLEATLREIVQSDVDLVLIDAPPILGLGDVAALARSAGGVLMVVRLDKARRPALLAGRESLEHLSCRPIGAVVVGERLDGADYYNHSYGSPMARAER